MIQDLPFFHRYDPASKQLTLRGATHIPEEIFSFADDIEILDVAHGSLTELPATFAQLHKLRIVFFSNNPFTEIPTVLAECKNLTMVGFKSCQLTTWPEQALPPSLRWLVLTDNAISTVPSSIGELSHLQKVSLAGNQIRELPLTMRNCQQLELLRLGANTLAGTPTWIDNLPTLAWYGDAGNQFSLSSTRAPHYIEIPWEDLKLNTVIGESPSSTVYSATYNNSAVAVKIYKNTLTSDGYIHDDINASIEVGMHANVMHTLGRIVGQPSGAQGIVLTLVPANYLPLGLPPSLESCTRDTFPTATRFSLSTIRTIAQDIAAACTHLHSKGIMHGDIYAHNILVNEAGNSKLGDFGAASLYDPVIEPWREYIEVRAFGYVLQDLLDRCADADEFTTEFQHLRLVEANCLQTTLALRPTFRDILEHIQ